MTSQHVSVLVCTRERPAELERCARSLAHLRFPHHPHTTVDLVVVDNTPGGTPGLDPDRLATLAGHPTRVVREPVTGIAPARNTALDHRHPHAHHVAFLDDDETATPTWLDHLLTTAHTHHADLVAGPALVRLPDDAPEVARAHYGNAARFLRRETGEVLHWAATGNLLVRAGFLDAHPDLRFDHRLGLTGGEDSDWTIRAGERGARIVWADRALVWHWVSAERSSPEWVRRRAFHDGQGIGRYERSTLPPAALARRGARVTRRAGTGLVRWAWSRALGRHDPASAWAYHVTIHVGWWAGALGAPRRALYRTVTSESGGS